MLKGRKSRPRHKATVWDIADIGDALDLGYDIADDHRERESVAVTYGKADRALDLIATALFGGKERGQ
jgi:hypothetical protein